MIARRSTTQRENGFTLLEIVVAVAIAGLALVTLFEAASGGVLAVDGAGRREEAIERAQSHLAAFRTTNPLASGDLEGDDGGGYRWRLRAHPVLAWRAAGNAPVAAAMTLYDVEVTISWRSAGRERSVSLATRRISDYAAQQ